MPRSSISLRFSLVVLALMGVGVGTSGCDTTDPPERGALRGIVQAEGVALDEVTVEVSGAQSASGTTDASGRYEFEGLPSGAYVVSIRNLPGDAAFPSTSRTAVVPEGGSVTVDFLGNFIRTAAIMGTVTVREQGLQGVTVRLSGTETATTQTDGDGEFRFPALRAGFYEVELTGFPQTVDFPTPRAEVTLGAGQTYEASFEGIPELTASVAIRNILRRNDQGQLEGVDPDNVRGRIEVTVALDRGEDRADSLLVLLGEQVVGRQYFSDGESGSGIAAAQQELVFPVNTAAFDEETGEPRFLNGERPLTVRLATREGGPSASVATVPVTLRNADTFSARLEPERGPLVGADGRSWVGGDLTLTLLPVIYSPDRQVSSVQVELRRRGGSQIARRSDAGTAPFEVVLSPDADDASSLAGYQTDVGEVDQLRVIEAGYSGGGSVQGLPIVLVDSLRVDQRPPGAAPFRLPTQGAASDCCRDSWIGSEFRFANALGESADTGVGGVTASFRAGPATRTDAELRAGDPVAGGDDLVESETNAEYRAIAVLVDALENERIVRLESTASNPAQNARGGVFGVDRTVPEIRLEVGSGSVGPRATNPASDAEWLLGASDGLSGIAAVPFRTLVRRYHPSLGTEPVCLFPEDGECEPALDGFLREVPAEGPGYLRLTSRALDRAGNRSLPLEAWVLRDDTDPEVVTLDVPATATPGAVMRVTGSAQDDVDLHRGQVGIRFGDPGSGGGVFPFANPVEVGTPFTSTLTPDATFAVDLPLVTGLELVSTGGVPDGTVLHATQAVGVALDAAGRIGTRSAGLPGAPQFQPRSFSVSERGQESGVERWELEAGGTTVCGRRIGADGQPGTCPEGTPEAIELRATAAGQATTFVPDFVAVHFMVLLDDGEVRWLGATEAVEMIQDGTGSVGRVWEWTLEWMPDAYLPAGTQRLIAVGVDGDGAALRTRELATVEIVPAR